LWHPSTVGIAPIRASGGRIVGASKIARDITERKRLQRMADEANRAKDEFLAVLPHDATAWRRGNKLRPRLLVTDL
jgi:hypothetical protein